MGTCRVCNNYIDSEHGNYVCSVCGFDESIDYGEYLLLGDPIETQPPRSVFLQKRDEKRLDEMMKERMTPVVNQLYAQIEGLSEESSRKDVSIRNLKDNMENQAQRLAKTSNMLTKRETELSTTRELLQAKSQELSQMEQTLTEKNQMIQRQQSAMNDMVRKIDELNQKNDQLAQRNEQLARQIKQLKQNPQSVTSTPITWNTGMIKYLGTFEQNDTSMFKLMGTTQNTSPIPWRVLAVEKDKAFLVSENILTAETFHKDNVTVNWKNCSMRSFLNDFYSHHFSAKEKNVVLQMPYGTSLNTPGGITKGGSVPGYITLLSAEEVKKYMPTPEQRTAKITPYARSKKAYASKDSVNGWWWLRDPGTSNNSAMYVNSKGDISTSGNRVNDPAIGVRPAMWVDINKVNLLAAK